MLPGTLSAAEPVVPTISPAHLILEQVERQFDYLPHTVWHKMRVASSHSIIRSMSKGRQTRFVRCTWGVRQDEYRWQAKHGFDDFTAFRAAATAMGRALVHMQVHGWAELLPGTMADLMDTRSSLYLADYWVLTLHHLVWSKRLPYAIKARWMQGTSIHNRPFCFVSELPTDLAEASMDALILLREAIGASPSGAWPPSDSVQSATVWKIRSTEPPQYRDGAWSSAVIEHDSTVAAPGEPLAPMGSAHTDNLQQMPAEAAQGSVQKCASKADDQPDGSEVGEPELNDQSFTVKFGVSRYRFTPRNKQLFALLERISRRPGFRVSFDDLRSVGDVWDGLNVEDSTIRGAVARLRKLLGEHAMRDLAGRITTGTYQGRAYVVLRVPDEDPDNP